MDSETKREIVNMLSAEARSRQIRSVKGAIASLVACFLFAAMTGAFLFGNFGGANNWVFVVSSIIGSLACYAQAQKMKIDSGVAEVHAALMDNADIEDIED